MRTGIVIDVTGADRVRPEAVAADRNSPQTHVWRARIVLPTAGGCGTNEIAPQAGVAERAVWRCQERFMQEGVAGPLRDKTRPSRIPPLARDVTERVVARALTDPPGETTRRTAVAMAEQMGLCPRDGARRGADGIARRGAGEGAGVWRAAAGWR